MILPKGFYAAGIRCGIKKKGKDLGLIVLKRPSVAAGVFTRNKNCSYSVEVSRRNIKNHIKAVLVNSGNANCFSHESGLSDTKKLCAELAKLLEVKKESILIASTGIIGKKLPFTKIISSFSKLIHSLPDRGDEFAKSILTTDTFPKMVSSKVKVGRKIVKVVGFAKGAGMINPSMATMLAFVLTDAHIKRPLLQQLLAEGVEGSFNSITVDGCMSTNDCVFFLASGYSAPIIKKKDILTFKEALNKVLVALAKMIVKDAEGATKFITLKVEGASTEKEACKVAFSIANSSLFKTAMYGANPNWGRVVAAIGASGVKVTEKKLEVVSSSLRRKEVNINVNLGRGKYNKTVYTCDLTPRYVKINAGYS